MKTFNSENLHDKICILSMTQIKIFVDLWKQKPHGDG